MRAFKRSTWARRDRRRRVLELRAVDAGYGRSQALFGVSLDVRPGEVLVLLGRNGAGKSTTLKTVAGLVRASGGSIWLDARRIDTEPAFRIARLGVGYVPEERRIFSDLTAAENLEVGRRDPGIRRAWTRERVCELFPPLAALMQRRGGAMSGGEQQMLAIARTLMGNPRFLLLDEPGEGLAPLIVEQLGAAIAELKREGLGMLLSEQNMQLAEAVGDRACVLESGRVRHAGGLAGFMADAVLRRELLGVS